MKTKVFENYEKFTKRKKKSVNGVSPLTRRKPSHPRRERALV